jgi:hypothetical protein
MCDIKCPIEECTKNKGGVCSQDGITLKYEYFGVLVCADEKDKYAAKDHYEPPK